MTFALCDERPLVCPDCGTKLILSGRCLYCPVCGWATC